MNAGSVRGSGESYAPRRVAARALDRVVKEG